MGHGILRPSFQIFETYTIQGMLLSTHNSFAPTSFVRDCSSDIEILNIFDLTVMFEMIVKFKNLDVFQINAKVANEGARRHQCNLCIIIKNFGKPDTE